MRVGVGGSTAGFSLVLQLLRLAAFDRTARVHDIIQAAEQPRASASHSQYYIISSLSSGPSASTNSPTSVNPVSSPPSSSSSLSSLSSDPTCTPPLYLGCLPPMRILFPSPRHVLLIT
ncbi:hypothetical protein B0T16DRAFT_422258 [Cercophora newfieldiana]|uniref:Uncharacterized protein n=1 Tax=Cercophora newfieldiana TaxID=92897 RepID=A0AA40CHV2_9PEZI|nr:hypothetical protein B0T16DRAFT_422258 [Cercophora newfieldiana]